MYNDMVHHQEIIQVYKALRQDDTEDVPSDDEVLVFNSRAFKQYVKELVSKGQSRNWKKIAAGSVLGLIIIAVIVVVIVVLTTNSEGESSPQKSGNISLEDILNRRYSSKSFNGSWISGKELIYRNSEQDVCLYDAESRTHTVLVRSSLIPDAAVLTELSADRKFLLVAHNYIKIFRYSFLATYDIIDLATQNVYHLDTGEGTKESRNHLVVEWSPQGNALVFVNKNNNLYYKPSVYGSQYKLTSSGSPGVVYHGVPDWIYEEEVLSSNKALWFSPNGKTLAFASFNDVGTRIMNIPLYGAPLNLDFQYTRNIAIHYPKPGTPNPTVNLTLVDLESIGTGTTRAPNVPPPDDLKDLEPILATVTWASDDNIAVVWMNRIQNVSNMVICNSVTVSCNNVLYVGENSGWVELFSPPLFSKNGSEFTLILPQDQGAELGHFRHVTLVNRVSHAEVVLTSGQFVVTKIVGWDQTENLIYFTATQEGNPANIHLYSVSDSPTDAPHKSTCISCNIKTYSGNDCTYVNAEFSKDSYYYVLSCVGPEVPRVTIHNKAHEVINVWEDNENARGELSTVGLPRIEYIDVDVADGFKAKVQLFLPPDIDTNADKKYPVLVNVYGGPDTAQVSSRFSVDWNTYLTLNKSIIYIGIDGRGSGLKGNRIMYSGYRRLGTVEVIDQITVMKYLQDNLKYIDSSRTAIWGWSYGGYVTGMVLANDTEGIFKCGISVAPVTDWLYYDSIYTERYMGLPTPGDNLIGYNTASLLNKVDNLRNKLYLLIHGTLDDNVHYQQSMLLSKVLEYKDILFSQQSYPDEDHGLASVRFHLYHTLGHFLDRCFE